MKRLSICAAAIALSACAAKNGTNGDSCSVVSNADGSATIACTNGTSTTINPGTVGATGTTGAMGSTGASGGNCTVADANGTATITCPGSSTAVSNGNPPCTTLEGDLDVSSPLDIAAFQAAGCTEIDGDLLITDDFLSTTLSSTSGLASLTTVTGNVNIQGDYNSNDDPNDLLQITTLDGLQNLASVGGEVYINGTTWLTDADLPALTGAPGGLSIGGNNTTGNVALSSIELPAFTSSGDNFDISFNPNLSTFSLGSLASVSGDLLLSEISDVTEMDFAQLATVGGRIDVEDNDGLTTLNLPALTSAGGLDIAGDGSFTTLTLSDLVSANDLTVNDTIATSLSFPALTTITDKLVIDDNVDLTSLSFPAGPVAVTTSADVSDDPDLIRCTFLADFSVTPTTTGDALCPP